LREVFRMKKVVMVLIALLGSASGLFAQTKHAPTRHPFLYHPVSQEQFARAVEMNDRKVIRVKMDALINAVNTTYGLHLENQQDLARYIRNLRTVDCPSGNTNLMRIKNDGSVDYKGWDRDTHSDEECLANSNGRVIFSLWCGNPTTNLYLPRQASAPARVVEGSTGPRLTTRFHEETPRTCTDNTATNYGGALPCTYPFTEINVRSGFPWKWVLIGAGTAAVLGVAACLRHFHGMCVDETTINIDNGSSSTSDTFVSLEKRDSRWYLGYAFH
jgi:hypothetical protein